MNKSESLPFSLDTESVSAWLSQLDEKDSISSGTKLFTVLKKLYRIRIGENDLLAILNLLTPSVLHLSENLSASLLHTIVAEGSVDPKSRKIARLCSQLLRCHCLAYCHAAANQPLDENRKAQAIFTAIQFAGWVMRTHTLISERNSSTLWQKTGELYRIACNGKINDLPISSKIPFFKHHRSIESVLKRNLLYALFDPYQAPEDKIDWYYDLADQYADLVEFEPAPNPSYNFYWDGNGKNPSKETPAVPDETGLIFNTEALEPYLLQIASETEDHDAYFFNMRQKLAGHQDILESIILSKPIAYCCTIGLTDTIERLKHLERVYKIHSLSGEPVNAAALSRMELVPMENEFRMRPQQHLTQLNIKSIKVEWINLQKAKIAGFFLGHARNERLTFGQPLLLYNEQDQPCLGIIRETIKSESPLQQVLIQVLRGTPKPIQIKIQSAIIEAVLIKAPSQDDTLLLLPNKYSTGDELIRADRPDSRYFLSKLIEAGEHFMHYRLGAC